MLMLRCALVMGSEGYVPEEAPVTHDLTNRAAILVGSLQMVAEHPWEALPPAVADVLRPELPGLADEIVAELSRGVPDYARPLEGPFGQALRAGVEEALGRFTRLVADPKADPDAGREVYLNLGRGEMRAGRSLDALLAAYRLGARVAWRWLAAAGERAGLSPRTLYTLAEAIFAYIDELSADSIEGYAREQAAAAGALQRRRQRLAALLVQDPPAAPATVEAAASNAGLRIPRTLSVLVVESDESSEGAERQRRAKGSGGDCGRRKKDLASGSTMSVRERANACCGGAADLRARAAASG